MTSRILPDLLFDLPGDRPDRTLLRFLQAGRFQSVSAGEFLERTLALAAGLEGLGVERGDRVALIAENRPEWPATDFATLLLGAITVPVYHTLPAAQVRHCIENSGARLVAVSGRRQLDKVLPLVGEFPGLERILVMDPDGPLPDRAMAWNEVGAAGERAGRDAGAWRDRCRRIEPTDVATILYTSGTTGVPKGVMLTHRNICFNIAACLQAIPFRSTDTVLSYLPLSHVFERIVDYICFQKGATIVYAPLDETLMDRFRAARPTMVPTVPRILEKIEAAVQDRAAREPGWRRRLFAWALSVGRRTGADRPPAGPLLRLQERLARRLVLDPLRERIVGREFRFFISGGAALPLAVGEFFASCRIGLLQGYGLTESPVISVNRPDRNRLGTVGPPLAGIEVRIAADGEVLTRGPQVMKGYYRNEAETREAFRDGWFHTGDIGRLDPDGFLSITDRKKDLIKTSGGKLVAPQPLENRLREDDLISEAVLVGEGRRFISALIVPEFDRLDRLASDERIEARGRDELLRDPRVLAIFERRIADRLAGCASFESVKRFRLLGKPLQLEEGELTPTQKVRRNRIAEKYSDEIEELYR